MGDTYICTRTHSHLYFSAYVENHEFISVPLILIQYQRVHSVFLSFRICKLLPLTVRTLSSLSSVLLLI